MASETVALSNRLMDRSLPVGRLLLTMAGITEIFGLERQQSFITSDMRVMTGRAPVPGHRRMYDLVLERGLRMALKTGRLPKTYPHGAHPPQQRDYQYEIGPLSHHLVFPPWHGRQSPFANGVWTTGYSNVLSGPPCGS
jgi:hypothetical protein